MPAQQSSEHASETTTASKPRDSATAQCADWCKGASHCKMCKCHACSFCDSAETISSHTQKGAHRAPAVLPPPPPPLSPATWRASPPPPPETVASYKLGHDRKGADSSDDPCSSMCVLIAFIYSFVSSCPPCQLYEAMRFHSFTRVILHVYNLSLPTWPHPIDMYSKPGA